MNDEYMSSCKKIVFITLLSLFSIKLDDVPPFSWMTTEKSNGFVCLNEFAKHFLNTIKLFTSELNF